ncbi:MAG TPA: hypothetical protein VFU15_16000 [Bacteroidia bacterium]|nr:hypothetical protein [Bacteroidia bacterium]
MKRLAFAAIIILLLASMKQEQKTAYSVELFPLNDTLVNGIDNTMTILKNGKPAGEIILMMSGASVAKKGQDYVARTDMSMIGKESKLQVKERQKVVLNKSFPVVELKGDLVQRVAEKMKQSDQSK